METAASVMKLLNDNPSDFMCERPFRDQEPVSLTIKFVVRDTLSISLLRFPELVNCHGRSMRQFSRQGLLHA